MGNCWTCFKSTPDERNATTAGQSFPDIRSPIDRDAIVRGDELLGQSPIHQTSIDHQQQHQHHNSGGSSFKKSHLILNGNPTVSDTIVTEQLQQQLSDNTLNALFEEYKDDQENSAIMSDGIERLCADLGYKPDDFAILVLAWQLDASQMCRFTKTEFIQGLQSMNADSIVSIQQRLEEIAEKLRTDAELFKQLYRFTFRFGLEPGYRILSLDMAIILWRLVFTVQTPAILEQWLHFLEQHPNIRGVPKDTWNMFLNFAETCDITAYDDTEAWPSLFDDFVDYETDLANQNLSKRPNVAKAAVQHSDDDDDVVPASGGSYGGL